MNSDEVTPIRLEGAGRKYGQRVALDGVDFELDAGRIAGLVGPNGSGKTTLLKLLAGLLRPHSGTLSVFGLDPFRERVEVMRRTRFAFAPPALFETLTAREHLVHLPQLGGGTAPSASELERALELVGLDERADEPVRSFSFGMRQRLGLAQALLPRPELLVLDEPTDGLDPLAVLELREVLRRLRDEDGIAVLLSSHLLIEVDQLVDDMLVLQEGRTVFRGTPAELRSGGEALLVGAEDRGRATIALRANGYVFSDTPAGELRFEIGAIELERAADLLVRAGTRLTSFRVERPSLESALLAKLRAAGADRSARAERVDRDSPARHDQLGAAGSNSSSRAKDSRGSTSADSVDDPAQPSSSLDHDQSGHPRRTMRLDDPADDRPNSGTGGGLL